MTKFRVSKPLSVLDNEQNIKLQNFTGGADKHRVEDLNLNPKAKPSKSFTVPLNEYELLLLQQLSQNLDRSQRYTSRMLLVKALEQKLNINKN